MSLPALSKDESAPSGMEDWIRAELPNGQRVGRIPPFGVPDGLSPGTAAANLNGMRVGFRWSYNRISVVVFACLDDAQRWPGFTSTV
jgi:hypothetical protein